MSLIFGPESASTRADALDPIFIGLMGLAIVIVVLVTTLITVFAIRYRAGSKARRGALPEAISREIEIAWTAITFFVAVFVFWWASTLDVEALWPPADALEIHVEAKQWMWKTRHPSGAREIDALHVPVDRAVKLFLTSDDVIHSFYVPAFRVKQDVVPGRVSLAWFKATKTGTFYLFCAEFCGTNHSNMLGKVVVMEPDDYARWAGNQPVSETLAQAGSSLFTSLGCAGCHDSRSKVRAPNLTGVFGGPVQLSDGRTVTADEQYVRDSILQPKRDIVAGFDPLMPSFSATASDAEVEALIAYVASLGRPDVDEPEGKPLKSPSVVPGGEVPR